MPASERKTLDLAGGSSNNNTGVPSPKYFIGSSYRDVADYYEELATKAPSPDPLERKKDKLIVSFYRRLAALERRS